MHFTIQANVDKGKEKMVEHLRVDLKSLRDVWVQYVNKMNKYKRTEKCLGGQTEQ